MIVSEFSKICKSPLRCISAYNGKILCYEFNAKKHTQIGEREVYDVWSDIQVTDCGFGSYARPILCVFVDGRAEREKEVRRNEKQKMPDA